MAKGLGNLTAEDIQNEENEIWILQCPQNVCKVYCCIYIVYNSSIIQNLDI